MCWFQHEALRAYVLSFARALRDACTGLSSLDTVNIFCSLDWERFAERAEMINFSPALSFSLIFFFFFLHFTHFILLSCNNPVHHNTHRSRFRMMFRVIWLWWKMSGCVDMDLQAHVASSTIHLPPNLKVLAGCVHLSMVLSSSHSPSPIFHWDMTMAPTAGSVYTSQKQPASSAITYAALHFDLKLGSHKTP